MYLTCDWYLLLNVIRYVNMKIGTYFAQPIVADAPQRAVNRERNIVLIIASLLAINSQRLQVYILNFARALRSLNR